MQDARKVVSSPRWQTQSKDERGESSATPPPHETVSGEAASTEAAGTPPMPMSGVEIASSLPGSDKNIDVTRAGDEKPHDDALDDEAEKPAVYTQHDWTPAAAMPSARQPLLLLTAACAAVAAIWSYSALENTRAQLNNVTLAKQTLERSLAEAQSRLSVAEKTVADVKAAITAATGAAKAPGTPAAK